MHIIDILPAAILLKDSNATFNPVSRASSTWIGVPSKFSASVSNIESKI